MYGGEKVVNEKGSQGHHERLNIQRDNGQTIYKKRNLTHSLQDPAQETCPLIYNYQPRKPACCKSDLQEARMLPLLNNPESQAITCITISSKWPGFD